MLINRVTVIQSQPRLSQEAYATMNVGTCLTLWVRPSPSFRSRLRSTQTPPMTMSRKLSFASVNMRQRNAAMHVLLNTNFEDDVLFVQEPWFNPVGTTRADAEINGKDVLGGAATTTAGTSSEIIM